MKKTMKIVLIAIALFVLFVVVGGVYTVGTTEDAVVVRMGDVKRVIVTQASDSLKETLMDDAYKNIELVEDKGIFFKIPFIDRVRKYDNRLITYQGEPRLTHTNDKKTVLLWDNAQWEVDDVLQFYLNIGTMNQANDRLGDILYSEINVEVGKTDAYVFLADKDVAEELSQIAVDRTNEKIARYGMHLQDDRLIRDYPSDNLMGIFSKMISERQELRNAYISEGEEKKQEIVSTADKEAAIILSDAEREASVKIADAEAEAARIIAEAYNANPEFYQFWKTLQTYRIVLPGTTIFLTPDSELLKLLYK